MSEDSEAKFITSQKGKSVFLYNGYKYNFFMKNKNGTTNWRCCNQRECKTSITLSLDKKVVRQPKHSCSVDFERNIIDMAMEECKQEVCKNFEPIPKIFEKHFLGKQVFQNKEYLIPSFTSKKDTLYRKRNNFLNVGTSKTTSNVRLPHHIVQDFFLFDDYDGETDDRIIIFSMLPAQKLRELFQTIDIVYGDGTFKVTPSPFYQLYTLHIDIARDQNTISFVPIVYGLLPNKNTNTYKRFFSVLRNQFRMNISSYKCDYEIAAINAIREVYPEIKVKGCYYDFLNAVFRMSKKLNFNETHLGRKITQLCTSLALLPPNLIPEAYLAIYEIAPETEVSQKFLDYFNNQWIQTITKDIFSCFGEKNRTTNAVEGWHRRINSRIPSRPTIFQFLVALKVEAQIQNKRLLKSAFHCPDKKRSLKYIENDRKINCIITDCLSNKIQSIECLTMLAALNKLP